MKCISNFCLMPLSDANPSKMDRERKRKTFRHYHYRSENVEKKAANLQFLFGCWQSASSIFELMSSLIVSQWIIQMTQEMIWCVSAGICDDYRLFEMLNIRIRCVQRFASNMRQSHWVCSFIGWWTSCWAIILVLSSHNKRRKAKIN